MRQRVGNGCRPGGAGRRLGAVVCGLALAVAPLFPGIMPAAAGIGGEVDTGFAGPARALDGDTLEVAGRRVHLWGIRAVALDQVCTDPDGLPWPCGRHAQVLLQSLVEGRDVTCVPTADGATGADGREAVCTVDGRDLAWAMVAFGFALDDTARSGGAYGSAEMQSSAVGAGVWSGSIDKAGLWSGDDPRDP